MDRQPGSRPLATGSAVAGAQPSVGAEVLQRLVDQAAYFNISSCPDAIDNAAIHASGNSGGVIGARVCEALHRFDVNVQPPSAKRGLIATSVVGEAAGKFTHRWMMIPDDFAAAPGLEPPQTILDQTRSQRFVMLDSVCTFGDGKDGFRGFGTGQTFPVTINGKRQLQAAAVGTILEGFGRFAGHDDGTYVSCGSFSPDHGFTGNLMIRVMDARGTLHTSGSLLARHSLPDPEPGITYIVFRGQADSRFYKERGEPDVAPRIGPNGRPIGLRVKQLLRLQRLNFSYLGPKHLESVSRVGPVIGSIIADVNFDPTYPGGTALNPIPFTTSDEFVFFDRGGEKVGSFTADTSDGRVFNIELLGIRGIRFGGTGKILGGTGPFAGMSGLMTDNSVVTFVPHTSASVYVLRIHDPDARYRAAINGG